jgi:hypothetical protein
MATEIKLWQVTEGQLKKLSETSFSNAHLERDLEKWVESDPSILGRELSVVGTQIYIPKVGPLDLLAVDQAGRLVVVEFKRQQTTRDSIAQILDYASSIRTMNLEQLANLQNVNAAELGEISDFDPAMILVAAEADEAAVKIVEYLVSKAQLPMEVVTFTFATLLDGQEIIARSILMPETIPSTKQATTNMTMPDILRIAAERKIEHIVAVIRKIKGYDWAEELVPRRRGYLRYWVRTLEEKDKALFSIDIAGERLDSPIGSVDLWFTPEGASEFCGLSSEVVRDELNKFNVVKITSAKVFIRLSTVEDAERLLKLLGEWTEMSGAERDKKEAAAKEASSEVS